MSMYFAIPASEFDRAQKRASFEGWRNFFRRRPNELLPFAVVRQSLRLQGATSRGLQKIELDKIVGSLGRDREFTRTFLPKYRFTKHRWQKVARLFRDRGFAPITVYKVGEVYFVIDGNHRVSVSRAHGLKTIEAYVAEYQTSVPIHKDDDLDSIEQKMKEIQLGEDDDKETQGKC